MILDGKTALVTGGGRGIGRAVSLRLASMGAYVGINYVNNSTAAEETLSLIQHKGGQAFLSQFDVADINGTLTSLKAIVNHHGSIDILVNNAGVTRDALMARMSELDWDTVIDTNLKGAFACTKGVVRSMMKRRWGRIINISSVVGFLGNMGQVNYGAAKAGMIGMTKSMARELAPRNVTVNCVAPGYIVTDMTADLSAAIQDTIKAQIPLGVLGQPEDVAAAVAFLASPDSNYVTGQVLHVNGGMYMSN